MLIIVFHSPTSARFCWMYSFIGSGCIWPEPELEISTFTFTGLDGLKPASASSFFAAAGSCFTSNVGWPNHGLPGVTKPLAGSIRSCSNTFSPSRSTARLAALRTRMSFHGEPSAMLRCQVQLCGYGPSISLKPALLRLSTASGAGVSIQSTWPERSAAVRVEASGIGSSTILSSFGTRALSQYSLFGTSSARVCGTKLVSFQGPVPDGDCANLFQSLPAFSHCAGLDIMIQEIWYGRKASGALVRISTV